MGKKLETVSKIPSAALLPYSAATHLSSWKMPSLYMFFIIFVGCASTNCKRKENIPPLPEGVGPKIAHATEIDSEANKRVLVFKYDGSRQCEEGTGQTVEEMAKQLAGVTIYSQENRYDGQVHMTVCGGNTGSANVYEIDRKDLPAAQAAGFKIWNFE